MASLEQLIAEEQGRTQAAYNPLSNTSRYSLFDVLARLRAVGRFLTKENIEILLCNIFPDTATNTAL